MNDTASKLSKLLETKAAIKQAIIDKGVEVPDGTTFDEYPTKIAAIEGGGGESLTKEQSDIINAWNQRTINGTSLEYLYCNYYRTSSGNVVDLDLQYIDFSKVTTISGMFSKNSIKSIVIRNMDTSNIRNMSFLFYQVTSLTELDLSDWLTSNVTNVQYMFGLCYSLETVNISNFDLTNCSSANYIFQYCDKLHTLRLDNCSNDTINKIITSSNFPTGTIDGVTRKIFVKADNIGDLTAPDGWEFVDCETGEVIVPEEPAVCEYCGEPGCDGSCTYCLDCGNLNEECTCTCLECGNLLSECTCGLEEIPVCEFCGEEGCDGSCQNSGEEPEEQEEPFIVATFGTDELVSMLGEPSYCWKVSFDNGTTWEDNNDNMTKGNEIVYLKPEDTNDIKIFRLFENSSYVTHIELHNFSAYPVYNYADYMFSSCSNLTELDLSSLNFSNGMNNLEGMFSNCNNLESLNLSSWSLGDETNTSNMLIGCNSLHTLRLDNCNDSTVEKIITSEEFPTGTIEGVIRKIYVSRSLDSSIQPPDGWVFAITE